MFGKKKKTRFEFLADLIYNHLKNGKFELAIAHYNKLENAFRFLSADKKQEFQGLRDSIKNLLTLYMDAYDLVHYAEDWDLSEVEDRLDRVEGLRASTDVIPGKLGKVVEENYNKGRDLCKYRILRRDFDDLLDDIEVLIGERNYDFALEKIEELSLMERKMKYYSGKKDKKLRNMVERLKRDIDIRYRETIAYSKPAVDVVYKREIEGELPILKPKSRKIKKKEEPKHEDMYDILRKHIESGNMKEIERIRQEINI